MRGRGADDEMEELVVGEGSAAEGTVQSLEW